MSKRLTYLKTGLWTLVGVLISVTVVRFTYGLGAVTNLSDATPWGLWIGFDVMSGVALAAGGFVLAAVVYIFGLERYRPFVRAAILTAFLGYAAVAVGLMYDLGLPWRIWHPLVNWQYHSVLFEVAMCVMLYLTVLALEFAPVILEHSWFDRPFFRALLRGLKRISILLVIAGIVLSTLHQSSLGSLFLITPDRLHPLWYSSSIYIQFFISAVALGLMTVVLESLFSGYFLGHKIHVRELGGLGLGASVVLMLYLALRLGDLAARGVLGMAFDGSWQGGLFLVEIGISAVIPAVLMLIPSVRSRIAGVGVAATMVVGGLVLHRLDVSIIAFARPEGMGYFPSWEELAVTLGIVAGAMLIFLFFVEHLKVFDDVRGHPVPEPRRFEPSTVQDLMAPSLGLPRRYSLALVMGATLALPFLPLGGAPYQPAPAGAPRWVEGLAWSQGGEAPRKLGFASASADELPPTGAPGVAAADPGSVAAPETAVSTDPESTLLLLIDGNRSGDLALFDHEAHEERLGADACATCHHLNLPLDEASSCSECHRDMFAPTPLFEHALHEAALGGDEGCLECHVDGQPKTMETSTACSECHEPSASDVVAAPEDIWRPAVGYMEAMHGLCVTCHENEVAESPDAPADLAQCSTCHDPDRRDQREELEPHRRTGSDAVALGRSPPPNR